MSKPKPDPDYPDCPDPDMNTRVDMIYKCDVCGKRGEWTNSWWWYGGLTDSTDQRNILLMCSNVCKSKIKDPKGALKAKSEGRPIEKVQKQNRGSGLKLVR